MSKKAVSQIQKHFQNHSLYKRSKRYLDIEKLNKVEHTQQIVRRSPVKSKESLDTKLYTSFTNSNYLFEEKRQFDISKYRKIFIEVQDPESQYQSSTIQYCKRSPKMSKMISREQANKTIQILTQDESRFNNFSLTNYNPRVDMRIYKQSQKQKKHRGASIQTSQSGTQQSSKKYQIYQKLCFNNSLFRCIFDYSKYRKPIKKKSDPNEYQREGKEFPVISSLRQSGATQFYNSIERSFPSPVHNKLKSNQYEFENVSVTKKHADFLVYKPKEQMRQKRLEQVYKKKQVVNNRDEMCDEKIFRRTRF